MTSIYKNILFFVVVAVSALYLHNNLIVISNIEQFMPSNIQNENVKILINQSQKGSFANTVLVQISESNERDLSRLSQELRLNLEKKTNIFDSVVNSLEQNNFANDILFKYRYLLYDSNFDVESLHGSFNQFLSSFTSNAPSEFIDYLLSDPQRVFIDYLSLNQPKVSVMMKSGVWFLDDSALLMVNINSKSDLSQKDIAISIIKREFTNINPDNAKLLLSGPSVIATEARANIKSTIQYVSIALSVVMFFVFVFVYRSPYLLILAATTLLTAILIAMTFTQLIFNQIHGIALAFGITTLGVCLDYPLHVFSNTSTTISAKTAVKNIFTPLKIGALTSILAYSSLLGTGFDGFTQLATFSIIGLLSAFIVSVYLVPAWMHGYKINKREVLSGRLLPLMPKILISFLIILLPVSYLSYQDKIFDVDISQLNPASEESKKVDSKLRSALGAGEIGYIFLISNQNLDMTLKKSHEVEQELTNLVDKGIIKDFTGVSSLLPSKKMQEKRLEALPSKQTLQNNISLAVNGLPFKKGAFNGFVSDVENAKTMPLLTQKDFERSFMKDRLQSILFHQDGNWYSLIRVSGIKDIGLLNKKIDDSDILKNTYYSVTVEASNIMAAYLKETWFRLITMLVLIFIAVLWFSRINKSRIWIFIPVISSVLISLSFQVFLGNSINIFHLLSLLLVVGLGFDYSLFFNYESAKSGVPSNSAHAVTISAITTIITFAILSFSDVSILSSIGQIVVVGVLVCFIISKFISTPTLISTNRI